MPQQSLEAPRPFQLPSLPSHLPCAWAFLGAALSPALAPCQPMAALRFTIPQHRTPTDGGWQPQPENQTVRHGLKMPQAWKKRQGRGWIHLGTHPNFLCSVGVMSPRISLTGSIIAGHKLYMRKKLYLWEERSAGSTLLADGQRAFTGL